MQFSPAPAGFDVFLENRMKKLALFVFTLGMAASAAAAPEVYVLDNDHTFPRFEYNHLGFSTQVSRFDKTTGKIVFDKQAKTGSVDVTIDMKSVNTGSTLFNEHIQGAEFLDTAKFPTATFKSTRVHFDGDKPSRIDGNLTLKGITKPVTLTVTSFQSAMHPLAKKEAIGANATTKLKRSDFKADKYAPYVSDELTLTIAMEALKQ
jgi:polyisoprenoid-binding protein YceI